MRCRICGTFWEYDEVQKLFQDSVADPSVVEKGEVWGFVTDENKKVKYITLCKSCPASLVLERIEKVKKDEKL